MNFSSSIKKNHKHLCVILKENIKELFLFFIIVMLLHGFLAFSITERECVGITVPDEVSFISKADMMYDNLSKFNLKALVSQGPDLGYGFMFWFMSSLIIGPLKHFGFSTQIVIGRIVSLAFLSLSVFFIYKIINLYQGHKIAFSGALVIFLFPVFAFFGKIYSVEYVSCSMAMCYLYCLLSDNYLFNKRYYCANVILGLAIGFKLSTAPLGIASIFYIYFSSLNRKEKIFKLWQLFFLVILGFFIVNPVLLLGKGPWLVLFKYIPGTPNTPLLVKLKVWYYLNQFTWDVIPLLGIYYGFGNKIVQGIFLLCYIFAFVNNWNNKKLLKDLTILTIAFIVSLLFICLKSRCYFTWYLFPSLMIVSIPVFFIKFKKTVNNVIFFTVFMLSIAYLNMPKILFMYKCKAERISWVKEKVKDKKKMDAYFAKLPSKTHLMSTIGLLLGTKGHFIWYDSYVINEGLRNLTKDIFRIDPLVQFIVYEKNFGALKKKSPKILTKKRWKKLLSNEGLEVDGIKFRFSKDFETKTAVVLRRIDLLPNKRFPALM